MGKYVHIEVSAIKDFSLIVNFRLPDSLCIACMDVAILVNICWVCLISKFSKNVIF